MRDGQARGKPRLTKEQEAVRLQGLRLLARMIVRAHLRSLIDADSEGAETAPYPGDAVSRKEGENAR